MMRLGPPLVVLLCALLLGPILVVVILSFSGDDFLAFPPNRLSLRWYQAFLTNPGWRAALWNSVLVASLCAVLATWAGSLSAYALVRGRFRMRGALMSLALMPLIVPSIVAAIALYFLSARLGLIGNRLWLAVTHAVVAFPVVLIIAQAAFQSIDPALERAAMIHGCGRLGVLRRVVVPMAAPGIVSAAMFAFLASFDELVIALFVSGINGQTLPVRIWNSLTLEVEPTIAAVSTVLIGVTLSVLLLDVAIRAAVARRSTPREAP